MAGRDLESTAKAIVAKGKGILAADESLPTIKKRFDTINVESSESNRRAYRQLLFTTPRISEFISGVILFDETIRQKADDGTPFVQVLQRQGVLPGIKVDKGAKLLAGAAGEKITEGLDGLRDRLTEYRELGAHFTKWRAVITIGEGIPTRYCIDTNAHALARYAALSQEAGLVPIVEPEVLADGDHSIDRCFEVNEATLREVFYQLAQQGVVLEGCLLKPSMVLSGLSAANRAGPEEVAEKTIACFKRVVPGPVPGVVFLSGGQTDKEATI
ncbi:MAG: fructose-bisphosphate aldolase class I, partial [Planctomycetota bacterium]|nr:fructose-bisphosphate aldolase class I [Planctomycetota bacterium]